MRFLLGTSSCVFIVLMHSAFEQCVFACVHCRFMRSRLCVFLAWGGGRECGDSMHLTTCLGPWPCLGYELYYSQRLRRWDEEFQHGKAVRTAAFWERYRCEPFRYSFNRSDSGRVVASVRRAEKNKKL